MKMAIENNYIPSPPLPTKIFDSRKGQRLLNK